MSKLVVTFGQVHVHSVNGKTFDKDCVAIIEADTIEDADELAFLLFNGKFHEHMDIKHWNEDNMVWYPRGYIEVD